VTTDDPAYYANVTHLFVQNDLVNQFNQQFVYKTNLSKGLEQEMNSFSDVVKYPTVKDRF
jgi:hypothetical protein